MLIVLLLSVVVVVVVVGVACVYSNTIVIYGIVDAYAYQWCCLVC